MPGTKPELSNLRLPIRIADGVRAKLDFDFACGRGHSFGEYHVHGVVNEILCSSLDPIQHRVQSGFPHEALQTPGTTGRRREVDFAVDVLTSGTRAFYAEVKWAGSSHCTQENMLNDLCRLQIIKDLEPNAECVFVLAGRFDEIDNLFSSGILVQGTACLLHRNATGPLREGGRKRRTKNFSLAHNVDHAPQLGTMGHSLSKRLPSIPAAVCTYMVYGARSATSGNRFQTLVWSVETS